MADTSQRKARQTIGSGLTVIDKNKEGASIAQGNETASLLWNVIRSEGDDFDNTENFNQSESLYFSTANATYNEAEKFLQALERKKSTLSYTVSFSVNQYTLDARVATVSELIANGIQQDLQDKTAYLSPVTIENGFITQFTAPATNTGSSTIRIQKYDGTYHTTLTLKKYNGLSLVNLSANDIIQNNLYTVIIIGSEAVLFGSQSQATATTRGIAFLTTQTRLTYNSPTSLLYSVIDTESNDEITNGTINLATVGVDGLDAGALLPNTSYYVFEIKDLTNNLVKTVTSLSLLSPALPVGFTKKKLVFAFITNASSQLRPMRIDADGVVTYITTTISGIQDLTLGNFVSAYIPLTVPTGVKCEVTVNAHTDAEKAWFILDGNSTFTATEAFSSNFWVQQGPDINEDATTQITVRTNTNREIRVTSWITSGGLKRLSLYTQSYKIIL